MKWWSEMTRPSRTEELFRDSPLTTVLTHLFGGACAAGMIYVFAFSDSTEERWQHFYVVLAIVAFLGACLALAKRREDRSPIALSFRRCVWIAVLVLYLIPAIAMVWIGWLRVGHLGYVALICVSLVFYLIGFAPRRIWRLLKTQKEANQTPEPMRAKGPHGSP